MFSSFADVCFAVKYKSKENVCSLIRKSLTKFWKTVYGKNFRKPFSFQNTRMLCLALFSFSLPLLTFSASALCLCSLPNSAEPPRAGLSSHNLPHLESDPTLSVSALSQLPLSTAPDPDPTRRSVSSWLRAARWDSSLDRSSWLRAARWNSSSDQSSWLMAAPGVCWVCWVCGVCGSVMVGLCDGGFAVMVALWVFFMVVCSGLR
jgi:hypothetical protein